MTDEEALDRFERGLRSGINRPRAHVNSFHPTTRETAIQYAHSWESAHTENTYITGSQQPAAATGTSQYVSNSGVAPMDLDALFTMFNRMQFQSKNNWRQQRSRNPSGRKTCFNCGAPNHLARHCLMEQSSKGQRNQRKEDLKDQAHRQ